MVVAALAVLLASTAFAAKAPPPADPLDATGQPVDPGRGSKSAGRAAAAAAGAVSAALGGIPLTPGQETRIEDKQIGGAGYYVVYLPREYTPDRAWPAIFCYHGLNGKPTTYPFHQVLGGKGFIIIGMEYYGTGLEAFNTIRYDIETVQRLVPVMVKQLNADPRQLFIGGFSQGGWATSTIAEAAPGLWAGIIITGAGRRNSGALANAAAFKDKAMYIGVGEKDTNLDPAKAGAEFYRGQGADVTFEMYENIGHSINTKSKVFADWLWGKGPLKQIAADLAEAKALQAAGKLGQAYARFTQVAGVPGEYPPCQEAAAAAHAIGQEAQVQLDAAEAAVTAKRYTEAMPLLTKATVAYAGSPFGERAAAMLAALAADPAVQTALDLAKVNAQARVLKEQAEAAELAKDYARAIRLYEQLAAVCGRSDLAPAARARLETLKNDKAVQTAIRDRDAERDCRGWLSMADNFIAAGLPDKAREYLQKILDKYPDTDWGRQAAERLKKLK